MTSLSDFRAFLPALGVLTLVAALSYGASLIESYGYKRGYSVAKSLGSEALEKRERSYAEEKATVALQAMNDAKEAARRLAIEQARVNSLSDRLAVQHREHRTVTDRLSGEIARVNDLYRHALDAEPENLPACVFTRGFVRVWNEATGAITSAPMSAAGNSSGAAAQVAEAQAVDQLDASIDRARILENHVRNSEQCKNIASQLDTLIDVVKGDK